jgi:hypothetical protein
MTTISLRAAPGPRLWTASQWIGLALTVALLAALVLAPTATLNVLWNMVIPLLPAVFLVNPLIWRNVCPLATINSLSSKLSGSTRVLEIRVARIAWALGVVLLAVMVPARRFLFNTNGLAMAVTITLVAGLAVTGGLLFARRGGFCNSVCPVLPVEKLYGQAPLVSIGTARCASCSVCTPMGCIELANVKTIRQSVGPASRDARWLTTAFGVFAAAFPGFIIGYFTTADGALATAPQVYGRVFALAALSYGIVSFVVLALRVSAARAMSVLGIMAFGVYYWFAAAGLGKAYGAPDVGPIVVRGIALVLVVAWIATYGRRAARPSMERNTAWRVAA